jgi:hypothetical protein
MRTVTDAERRARLGVRHALAEPASDVVAAARAVVCLHATEPTTVHLSAWARSGAARTEVDSALYGDRSLVKQLAMRRTVFAVPVDLLPAARVAAQQRAAGTECRRWRARSRWSGLGRRRVRSGLGSAAQDASQYGPAAPASARLGGAVATAGKPGSSAGAGRLPGPHRARRQRGDRARGQRRRLNRVPAGLDTFGRLAGPACPAANRGRRVRRAGAPLAVGLRPRDRRPTSSGGWGH